MFDIADDGLSALMDVNVFHNDVLLSLASVPVESLQLRGVCPAEICWRSPTQVAAPRIPGA
jgi:hypothetical protein